MERIIGSWYIYMKTIKELELSLIVKEAMIQQLKLKNNQLEERIYRNKTKK